MDKSELQNLIATAASSIAATILDNYIRNDGDVPCSKGEIDMANTRQKFHITLPNGEKVWLTGNTISDAFCSGLAKYGGQFSVPTSPKDIPNLMDYGEKWFQLYHQPNVKPNTAKNTHSLLKKHIYPALGSKTLDRITFDDIQAFYNSKKSLSRSTNEKLRIALTAIFNNAMEDGLIKLNVMSSSRYTISKKRTKRDALSRSDAVDILRQVPLLKTEDRPFIMLPLLTGMRRGECLGLLWDDIDFQKKLITVDRAITFDGNQPVIDKPKSEAGYRQIPLLPDLESFLMNYPRNGPYIIGGNAPITEQTYQRTWDRIRKTIDTHGATAHVFRHTFATFAEPHTDVKNLQAIMGHSDIKTTMNRYTHKQEERVRQAASTLDGMYSAS